MGAEAAGAGVAGVAEASGAGVAEGAGAPHFAGFNRRRVSQALRADSVPLFPAARRVAHAFRAASRNEPAGAEGAGVTGATGAGVAEASGATVAGVAEASGATVAGVAEASGATVA